MLATILFEGEKVHVVNILSFILRHVIKIFVFCVFPLRPRTTALIFFFLMIFLFTFFRVNAVLSLKNEMFLFLRHYFYFLLETLICPCSEQWCSVFSMSLKPKQG